MASSARLKKYRIIHSILNDLDWTEEQYRNALYGAFEVESKTVLDLDELDDFITLLQTVQLKEGQIPAADVEWGWGRTKYEALAHRPGDWATPAQMRKIEATWREVARDRSDDALQTFLENHVGVSHITWLKKQHVKPVLVALKEMKRAAGIDDDVQEEAASGDGQVSLAQMTQRERVLWWLRNQGTLTPREAETQLGVGRLAARIHELRTEGHDIATNDLEVEGQFNTATVAEYELIESNDS